MTTLDLVQLDDIEVLKERFGTVDEYQFIIRSNVFLLTYNHEDITEKPIVYTSQVYGMTIGWTGISFKEYDKNFNRVKTV